MNDFINNIIGYGSSANSNFGNSLNRFASGINGYGKPAVATTTQPVSAPVSSSPASVSPTSQTTTNPMVKTPAAQAFVSSLTPQQQAGNNAMTQSGNYTFANGSTYNKSTGGFTSPNTPTVPTTLPNNPSLSPLISQSGNPATSPSPTNAYSQYLSSKIAADSKLANIQSQEDAQSQGAREQQEQIISQPGGLLRGAQQASSVAGREAGNAAADLAVQEGAAARSATVADNAYTNSTSQNKPISVGNQLYQLQPDGSYKVVAGTPPKLDTSTVEVNGRRELINNQTGEVIKNLGSSTATGSTAPYVAGTDPVADSWVKYVNGGGKITDVPAAYKNAVAQGVAQSGGSTNQILTTTSQSLQELNDLVDNNNGFSGAVGAKGISSLFGLTSTPIAGTNAANFDAKLNQVKNDVILPNLALLHGLGRVTDREFQALSSAITSLSTNQSESAFKESLKDITNEINQKLKDAGSPPVSSSSDSSLNVTDPSGGIHTFKTASDAQAFKNAITQK